MDLEKIKNALYFGNEILEESENFLKLFNAYTAEQQQSSEVKNAINNFCLAINKKINELENFKNSAYELEINEQISSLKIAYQTWSSL